MIHEDEHCLAFLTLHPIREGEFLVIPRAHIDHFTDLDDTLAAHILVTAQRLARHARAVLRPLRMGYVVHGFGVPHAHLNVIPQHAPDDILSARYIDAPHGYDIRLPPARTRSALDEMAKRLTPP